jgi:GNAT superfamily N-acetyltransferase
MQFIDAYWEQRNFGVSTVEMVVEPSDDVKTILSGLQAQTAAYQVVKLPVEQINKVPVIQDEGFNFIEAIVLVDIQVSSWKESFPEYRILSGAEQTVMLDYVSKGMYHTDRFSNDNHFNEEQVSGRYVNVINDELGRGGVAVGLVHQEEIIGFTIVRRVDDKQFNCPLTGIYPPYQGKGLSKLFVGCPLAYVKDQGGEVLLSGVSTNNMISLRTHFKGGYMARKVLYLFVKHA